MRHFTCPWPGPCSSLQHLAHHHFCQGLLSFQLLKVAPSMRLRLGPRPFDVLFLQPTGNDLVRCTGFYGKNQEFRRLAQFLQAPFMACHVRACCCLLIFILRARTSRRPIFLPVPPASVVPTRCSGLCSRARGVKSGTEEERTIRLRSPRVPLGFTFFWHFSLLGPCTPISLTLCLSSRFLLDGTTRAPLFLGGRCVS